MKPGQIVLGRILFVKLRHHVSSRTEVMSVPATVQAAVWGRVYVCIDAGNCTKVLGLLKRSGYLLEILGDVKMLRAVPFTLQTFQTFRSLSVSVGEQIFVGALSTREL